MLKLRNVHLKDIGILKDLSFNRENFSKLNKNILRNLLQNNYFSQTYVFLIENEDKEYKQVKEEGSAGDEVDKDDEAYFINDFVAFLYFEESLDDNYNLYLNLKGIKPDFDEKFFKDFYFLFFLALKKFSVLPDKIFMSVVENTIEDELAKFLDFKLLSQNYLAKSNSLKKVYYLDLNEIFAETVFVYPLPDSLFVYHFADLHDYKSLIKASLFCSAELFSTSNINYAHNERAVKKNDDDLTVAVFRSEEAGIKFFSWDSFMSDLKPEQDGMILLKSDFIAYNKRVSDLLYRRLFYGWGLLAANGSLSKKSCRDFAENLKVDKDSEIGEFKLRIFEALDKYMKNELKSFPFSLFMEGTEFRLSVWKKIFEIPYGEMLSYSEIGESLDVNSKLNYSRAVGRACGANPLPIFVPCHRVIGKHGKITGFTGGIRNKERLLANERLLN